MPSGVIFVIYIPSSNYEHVLKFGKPKELLPIDDSLDKCRLEVELRNKRENSIPIYLTQSYYTESFNPKLENINEDTEFITMESVSEFIHIQSRTNTSIKYYTFSLCSQGNTQYLLQIAQKILVKFRLNLND